jgi:hypothetical protein
MVELFTLSQFISGKQLFNTTRNCHIRAQLKGKNLKEIVDQREKDYEYTQQKSARIMKTLTKCKPHEHT